MSSAANGRSPFVRWSELLDDWPEQLLIDLCLIEIVKALIAVCVEQKHLASRSETKFKGRIRDLGNTVDGTENTE